MLLFVLSKLCYYGHHGTSYLQVNKMTCPLCITRDLPDVYHVYRAMGLVHLRRAS